MTTHLNSFGLKDGWLDEEMSPLPAPANYGTVSANYCVTNGVSGTLTTNATNLLNTTGYVWPYQQTYGWYYPPTDRRPIKLAMSEIAKLRQAAKRDAKLKAILAKFTDQIEVTVDFE